MGSLLSDTGNHSDSPVAALYEYLFPVVVTVGAGLVLELECLNLNPGLERLNCAVML